MKSFEVMSLIHTAEEVLPIASGIDGRGRTGFCLCVSHNLHGEILVCTVGVVLDLDREFSFRHNCREKAARIFANKGHVSSWQSRAFDAKKYGGGILVDHCLAISISGFSEHVDEATSAAIAFQTSTGIAAARWQEIATISQNPHLYNYGMLSPKV